MKKIGDLEMELQSKPTVVEKVQLVGAGKKVSHINY